MRRKGRAFTLIEMLVVIGIFSLLTAILLPTLTRARERANQLICLSNLRQLGMAVMLYCQDNQGWFPRAAPYATTQQPESPQDFLWWQQNTHNPLGAPNRDIFNSPVLKYLGIRPDFHPSPTVVNFNEERQRILRCPSDVLSNHLDQLGRTPNGGFYYSYSINNLMQSFDPNIPLDGGYLRVNANTGQKFQVAGKLVKVHLPATKILMVEESEATIDDGSFDPTEAENLLSVRHDHSARQPDAASGFAQINGIWTVKNGDCRGNVAFCDGHVDYVFRSYVNDPNYQITHDIDSYDWAK
jgi:prepilin-type N-terminal cleavage/methylation domain-containing protein/prepilin-type processing-associated H-X9-DG protein